MKWEDVKSRYPNRWLLLEATSARTENGERIVDAVAVIDAFQTSDEAWKAYAEARRQTPGREFIPLHSDYAELRFRERPGISLRVGL